MFSSSNRSSMRVGRVFIGVVLVLLSMAIFAGLEAWGAEGPATPVAAATLTAADSAAAAVEFEALEVVARVGRDAVRVLTTMMTVVFEGWRHPVDSALDWVDGIRRGWAAVHRLPGPDAPGS